MSAREKFKVGNRVRAAGRAGSRPAFLGAVAEPWSDAPTLVRVRRDSGRETVDGLHYWNIDENPPPVSARAATNRSRRNGDNALHRLVVGAVRHADAIDTPEPTDERQPDYHQRFMATDEELRETALAFARSLSPADRKRLGR